MLNLQAKAVAQTDRVTFNYLSPTPFRSKKKKLKLIDIWARPESETSMLSITGTILPDRAVTSTFTLQKVFSSRVLVVDIGRRLKSHSNNLISKMGILRSTPQFDYSQSSSKFRITLPPRCGVFGKTRLALAMFGFFPNRFRSIGDQEDQWWGFLNEDESELETLWADEASLPNIEFRHLQLSLNAVGELDDDETAQDMRDLEFLIVFQPSGQAQDVSKEIGFVETPEEVQAELQPMLLELEKKMNLTTGTLRVEVQRPGLAFFAFSRKSYNLRMNLTFDAGCRRLLSSQETYSLSLSNAGGNTPPDGKWGLFTVGPITKLTRNALEPLLPLLIRLEGGPFESYTSGLGASHIIAFLDQDGGIFANPFGMEDYDGVVEIHLHRRDLSEIIFDSNLIVYAHFAIMSTD